MKSTPLYLRPLQTLMGSPALAGILLLVATVVALTLANSPLHPVWQEFWHQELAVDLGPWGIRATVLHWINDGLMALFFFTVGLELKREFLAGSLSSPRQAILPLAAAAGGMVVPALVFLLLNPSGPASVGWGIPMATDIAFAVGLLSLLGSRVPLSLKVFITALAIADDLGAVLVIAFFYTSHIDFVSVTLALFFVAVLAGANALGVRRPWFYGLVGIGGIWLSFLSSGIHASVAGVLIAFTIPARPRVDEGTFGDRLKLLTQEFLKIPPNNVTLLEPAQVEALGQIEALTRSAGTPLQRLEHSLGPLVSLIVMPLFALANAGITFDGVSAGPGIGPVASGVFFGLLAGKWIGIVGVTGILVLVGWARLPGGMGPRQVVGAGFLGGIGFTMSLFITSLAFGESALAGEAKLGILLASLVAGVLALAVLGPAFGRPRSALKPTPLA